MRPRTNKSGPMKAAANGVWHDDQFGFFAVGFVMYLAAMALGQIQRSTASAAILFLTENRAGSARIFYRRSRSLFSGRQRFGTVALR